MLANASIYGNVRLLVIGVPRCAMPQLHFLQIRRPARPFASDVRMGPDLRQDDVPGVGLVGELS